MTGKVTLIFPGFQGFPGAVGILHTKVLNFNNYDILVSCILWMGTFSKQPKL